MMTRGIGNFFLPVDLNVNALYLNPWLLSLYVFRYLHYPVTLSSQGVKPISWRLLGLRQKEKLQPKVQHDPGFPPCSSSDISSPKSETTGISLFLPVTNCPERIWKSAPGYLVVGHCCRRPCKIQCTVGGH